MDSELVPGGPVEAFLQIAGNRPEDFRTKLKEWNPGAIALFLAEFAYQDKHDSKLYAAVETVLHDDEHSDGEPSSSSHSSVEHDYHDHGKRHLTDVQRSLQGIPETTVGNEAVNMI
jgi:hypothetical protein